MNTSKIAIYIALLSTISACNTASSWMKQTKGNPQQQVILGERKQPALNSTPAAAPSVAMADSSAIPPTASPSYSYTPQKNVGETIPAETQQTAPSQQGWANESEAVSPPKSKGLFSWFSKKEEPVLSQYERRRPALNSNTPVAAAAPTMSVVESGDNKAFPKLNTVPETPKPQIYGNLAQENVRQMEKARDDLAAENKSAPATATESLPNLAAVPAGEGGSKDGFEKQRWADSNVRTPAAPAPIIPVSVASKPEPQSNIRPQVDMVKTQWHSPDSSTQMQKVEVPDSVQVVGVPMVERASPAEPIILVPRAVASSRPTIPESRYADRRRQD